MAIVKLDKEATKEAIINRCKSGIGFSIKEDKFDDKIKTVKDYLETCQFVGIDPIYV